LVNDRLQPEGEQPVPAWSRQVQVW